MGCARKTDPAVWSALFSIVGSPLALLHSCVQAGTSSEKRKKIEKKPNSNLKERNIGALEIASSYLPIVRYLEGYFPAFKAALQLMQIAISRNYFDVGEEKHDPFLLLLLLLMVRVFFAADYGFDEILDVRQRGIVRWRDFVWKSEFSATGQDGGSFFFFFFF
jgi:hypothetical protein